MKIKEMRIDKCSFDTNADYSSFESFSIGHESCIIKFLEIINNKDLCIFLQEQKNKGKDIRILTPFVPQSYLEKMKFTLRTLFRNSLFEESMIIVNDLGMMHYIHKVDPNRKICLGRTWTFSFDFTPWGELIYANESSSVQKVVKQVNLYDDIKIDYFKNNNVVALESNITANTVESLENIVNNGIDVYINCSYYLYGIQRSCYIRRFSHSNQCDYSKCDEYAKVSLRGQWEEGEIYCNETVNYFPSKLFMHGNQICGLTRYDSKQLFNCIYSE